MLHILKVKEIDKSYQTELKNALLYTAQTDILIYKYTYIYINIYSEAFTLKFDLLEIWTTYSIQTFTQA